MKVLTLTYSKPYFADTMLARVLNLPGQEEENIFIYKLTVSELYIMMLYPVNAYEQDFYLEYYRRKGH